MSHCDSFRRFFPLKEPTRIVNGLSMKTLHPDEVIKIEKLKKIKKEVEEIRVVLEEMERADGEKDDINGN